MVDGRKLRVLFAGATMEPDWQGGEPIVADLLRRGLEQLGAEVVQEGSRRTFAEFVALALVPYDAEFGRIHRYRRRLRELRPDVVLVFYDFDCSWILAARKEGVPVVACIQIYWATCPIGTHYIEGVGPCSTPALGKCLDHMSRSAPSPNLALPVPGLPAPLGFALYSKLWTRPAALGQADALAANSEFTARVLRRAGYRKVHAIHNSVDAELFREGPWEGGSKVVLYPVARSLQERKGYPHFVRLATAIRAELPEVRFRVLNHKGDDLLEGTPYLTHEQLASELRSDYLAVIPGLWDEPFGLVTTEAMAAGRPVVGYEGGAMAEIIENGVSGVLVPRGNVNALTRAVLDLLKDESMARRIGRAARIRVEGQFRYQLMAERYLALIRQVMDRSAGANEPHPSERSGS